MTLEELATAPFADSAQFVPLASNTCTSARFINPTIVWVMVIEYAAFVTVAGGAYNALVPSGQTWHELLDTEPDGDHMCSVRCWQLVHCDASVSPSAEENVPPGQGMHAVDPSTGANDPAGQTAQAVAAVAADALTRYVPSPHGEQ